MVQNPEIINALEKIANGKIIKYLPKYHVEINGIKIHCRFKTGSAMEEQYVFNINPNTLTSQYELWVCGSSEWYYLIPINIIRNIYNDLDTYESNTPGQESLRIIHVVIENDELKYGRNNKKIQITNYWNKIF